MMKMDDFQRYRNIHVVDLIAFGVLLVFVLDDCVLGFFGSGRDILADIKKTQPMRKFAPEKLGMQKWFKSLLTQK
jgi:hypothetical protein